MVPIVPNTRFWFLFSGTLFVLGAVLIIYPGLKLGLDFTGGTLLEVKFDPSTSSGQAPLEKAKVEDAFRSFEAEQGADLGEPYVLETAGGSFIVRTKAVSNEQHVALQEYLRTKIGPFTEKRFTTIGPTVGQTLKIRSLWAIAVASLLMVLFIAFAFRNVPRKLNPWKFGIIAVVALLHDVTITIGVFAFLGIFTTFEVNTLFVTALLVVLGYSVHDTIVIFDRIRENVREQQRNESFAVVAERGLQQTMARSFNTSFATLLPLFALFFLGGETIKWFVLALIVGITLGTYSSIFLATPLLVVWRRQD